MTKRTEDRETKKTEYRETKTQKTETKIQKDRQTDRQTDRNGTNVKLVVSKSILTGENC